MNITTLPIEMVTSILKYLPFEELHRLRKMNRQIDSIIKKSKLAKRIPVNSCKVFCRQVGIPYVAIDFHESMVECLRISRNCKNWRCDKEEFAGLLAELANKIRIRKSLEWGVPRAFNYTFFDIARANKEVIKNLRSLTFFSDPTYPWNTQMKEFISHCPKLNSLYIITRDEQSSDTILNTQVLGGRKWTRLSVDYDKSRLSLQHLDNSFLMEVIMNCDMFTLNCEQAATSITIPGILSFLQTILAKGEYTKTISIRPYVQLGDMLISDVPKNILNVTGRDVEIEREYVENGGIIYNYTLDFDGPYLYFTILAT